MSVDWDAALASTALYSKTASGANASSRCQIYSFEAAANYAQHAVNHTYNTELAHRSFITVITIWQGWCVCMHAAHIYSSLLSAGMTSSA